MLRKSILFTLLAIGSFCLFIESSQAAIKNWVCQNIECTKGCTLCEMGEYLGSSNSALKPGCPVSTTDQIDRKKWFECGAIPGRKEK